MVGTRWPFTTPRVSPRRKVARESGLAATTRSQPSRKSVMPGPSRAEDSADGSSAMRRWLLTAPFFC